ncbi:protein kinase domain-containing protein [Sandaracinus amylolyticus]|uniref:Serine/threonine protein kinase PrkC, regulation of stationary phase n=1 Tax=Sandaracinus amylolyticus TaxID=927083 RepID=A0A0F6YJD0_9BACT|nr:tetratricopeptide repeat protein [Sandaracinus amylolyticus]AKF07201.1 Serine/threonine protein kinase PrkC, regulation of stationary phase [Sandaracinus amylolyticus]
MPQAETASEEMARSDESSLVASGERPTADAPDRDSSPAWRGVSASPAPRASYEEPIAPGTVIAGRFRVGRALGRGGHGTVYQAEHVSLGYPVAVKVLHAGFGLDARRRARFRREALLGARLRHRNVVSILDAGELEDGAPFLVMEHVDGADLESVIDRSRLDAAATIEIGVQLLAGLTALGERGVIHRDIKPSNVMLQRCVDGYVEVKLLDFGISKAMRSEIALETLTADDCVLGTPQYMPPEQVRGEPLDVRADLYSVGCVLYECLVGDPPFDAETPGGVLARVLTERAKPVREVRPDVPAVLAVVIDRALARDAADRWRHPAEMSEALRAAAQELGLPLGIDAWSSVDREASPLLGTMPIALVQRASAPPPRASSPSAEPRPAPVTGTSAAWARLGLARVRTPSRRWRRALAGAVAVPVALGIAAATWGADDGTSAPAIRAAAAAPRADVIAPAKPSHVPSVVAEAPPAIELEAPAVAELLAPEPDAVDDEAPAQDRERSRARRHRDVDVGALESRALQAFVAGREREALGVYQRATELAPDRASAWRGFGLAAAAVGDRGTASRALRRYLELAPGSRDQRIIEQRLAQLAP